jgi:hypothetical protein
MKRLEFKWLGSGVQGMGIWAGKRDILRKKRCAKKMAEKSKSVRFKNLSLRRPDLAL